ncbi:MAG TPA: hypothetical protein VF789_08120 [Thermoanaerobaculia bacterium]
MSTSAPTLDQVMPQADAQSAIRKLCEDKTDNPVAAQISDLRSATMFSPDAKYSSDDLVVFDCATCPAEEVSKLFGALAAGAGVLLLDATDAHKKALAAHVGFRSHGGSRGYFVARRAVGGKVGYHFHEAKDTLSQSTLRMAGSLRNADGSLTAVEPTAVFTSVPHALTSDEAAGFIKGFLRTLAMPLELDTPPPAGLIYKNWTYSKPYSYPISASENESTGLGPPPSTTVSLQMTYVFDGALDNADQAGAFQYIGCSLSGILSNGGLKGDSGESFGWSLANFNAGFSTSSDELFYYSSSPANSSGASSVQTGSDLTVGFSTNGVGGTYTFKNSVTNNITDWQVVQNSGSSWNYAQVTPFDGNATDNGTIDNCIDWAHGDGVQTGEFPTISTSSLQFAVNTVWKTNAVVNDVITFQGSPLAQVDYIMTQVLLGATNKEASWVSKCGSTDYFDIDMSTIS